MSLNNKIVKHDFKLIFVTKKLKKQYLFSKNNTFDWMNTLVKIFSLYFLFLIAIPTFKVLKSQLGMSCAKSCHNENKKDKQKGCQKEKCILNINFSSGQFIVAQIQNITFNSQSEYLSKKDLTYEMKFIPKYKDLIWEPPESNMFT